MRWEYAAFFILMWLVSIDAAFFFGTMWASRAPAPGERCRVCGSEEVTVDLTVPNLAEAEEH